MDKAAYDYINDYCSNKYPGVLLTTERDFVLRKFLDSYFAAIDSFKEQHKGNEPTQDEEKTIISSLMNDNTMNSYIDSAKSYYEKYKTSIENEYRKKLDFPNFWKNIGINILSNLLYSAILIVVFLIAKDQIATWLASLAG